MKSIPNTPLVSVIVPNYNYAGFLKERIDSILAQSIKDIEIILLDDASTDDSASVLASYGSLPEVSHVIVNPENSGSPFSQWLKGIGLARGKYIWIAEADDLAAPQFLEKALPPLEKDPQCLVSFSGSVCINDDGSPCGIDHDRWNERRSPSSGYAIYDGDEYIRHNLYWRCYIYNASGAVWRREAFRHIAPMTDSILNMRNSGDWLFWTLLAANGRVSEIYERTNRFRIHDGSATIAGRRSGRLVEEDMDVVACAERLVSIDSVRKTIRHGGLYKNIRRIADPNERERLRDKYISMFGSPLLPFFADRVVKPLAPAMRFLPSERNDRL